MYLKRSLPREVERFYKGFGVLNHSKQMYKRNHLREVEGFYKGFGV